MSYLEQHNDRTRKDFERSLLDEEIESMLGIAADEEMCLLPAYLHSQRGIESSVSSDNSEVIPTPPPDASPEDYTYTGTCTLPDKYIRGSSLEELTPVSSPDSCKEVIVKQEKQDEDDASYPGELTSPLKRSRAESFEDSSDEDEQPIPKSIKLPQRKGGMQLWQFLYTLLTDPKKRYKEMIEWTSNDKAREFRLLEPEAIAIWWGEHKNKKNMSYDKLSRSLRYYYDKGIIRKIPGERYVYRFCVDPEIMYKHIGNSECRPKLKAMPNSAKISMSKYQTHVMGYNMAPLNEPVFIAQGPIPLSALQHSLLPSYPFPFAVPSPLPPAHPLGYEDAGYMHEMASCPGSIHGPIEDIKPLTMRRSHSLDSCYGNRYREQRSIFDHQDPLAMFNGTNPLESLYCMPPPQLDNVSPNAMSSGTASPSFSIGEPDELDLDTLIEIASSENYTTPNVYSPPIDSKPLTIAHQLPTWNF